MANDVVVDDKIENVNDIINSLSDPNDGKVVDEDIIKDDVKEDDSKKDDEKEEVEEELELEPAEDDDIVFNDIPARKVILAKFPDLYKTFPGIEKALYRENQYTEIFPTVKDAKAASEELSELKELQSTVLEGSLENILKVVKENEPDSYNKITGNLLQTLAKVDEKAYYGTIAHVIDRAIYTFYQNGKQIGGEEGEQFQIAAQLLNKFVKGSTNITVPQQQQTVDNKEDNERENKIKEREKQFAEKQLHNAVSDVTERAENLIKSTVDKYIDVKEQMTPYIRDKAVKDVLSQLEDEIEKDTRFKSSLDKAWLTSRDDDYSKATKDKIRNMILTKAKTVLPDIIRRVRADALKGSGAKVKEVVRERSKKEDDEPQTKTSSRTAPTGKRLSTLDVLNQD